MTLSEANGGHHQGARSKRSWEYRFAVSFTHLKLRTGHKADWKEQVGIGFQDS